MLKPDDTFWCYFTPDKGDKGPALLYRAETARYWIDFGKRRKALDTRDAASAIEAFGALATEGLLGWQNMPGEFNTPDDLLDVVGPDELVAIVAYKPMAAILRPDVKKKSESQLPSNAEGSAAVAGHAGA